MSSHKIRFSDMIDEPRRMLPPIKGFEHCELVSLEKSVESLISIVPELDQMVYIVQGNCLTPEDGLTPDESASIMLYSMEWSSRDGSFYYILNKILRSENRQLLKPWFSYLRLFIHSLSKLPSFTETIYRGIKMDLIGDYPIDQTFVWWAFSSCTDSIGTLQNEEFFGQTGKRTLFAIESSTGKNIRNHSIFPTENEVLLVSARQFRVVSHLNAGNDLHMIQIKEIQPPFPFISCSPTSNHHHHKFHQIFQKCPNNSDINLEKQNLNDQDLEYVVQEAMINKQCKKLLLRNNQITSQGALTIANALLRKNNLEELILYHNHLSDDGVQHLSKALSMNNSMIQILGLGSNDITDLGIKYLSQMIKTNRSLLVLGLVFNQITDQGVTILADAFLQSKTNIRILYRSKNRSITDASVNTFIQMVHRNDSLREIWMQNCSFSENGKQKLRQSIKSKRHFRFEF